MIVSLYEGTYSTWMGMGVQPSVDRYRMEGFATFPRTQGRCWITACLGSPLVASKPLDHIGMNV